MLSLYQEAKLRQRTRWVVVLLIVTFWIPSGCGSQGSSATNASTSSAPTKTEPAQTAPAQYQYAIDQGADLDDETLTVNGVEHNYNPDTGSFTPRPGNEFIRVNITLTNEGKSPAGYNEFYYKVKDSNGLERGVSLIPVREGFTRGTVAPGEAVTGNMVFEVPQDDSGLKLIVGDGGVVVQL